MKRILVGLIALMLILVLATESAEAKQRGRSRGGASGRSTAGRGSSPAPRASTPSSGRSYSSGGPGATGSPSVNPKPPSNSSKTYSSGAKSVTIQKPASSGVGLNRGMSNQAKRVESKARYEAATTPKATYTTPGPGGVTKPVPPNAPQVQTIRRTVTHERYVTYDNRAQSFYGGYYARPTYYRDFYSPFLMGFLFSSVMRSSDRATWMYHHEADMDQARYHEMLSRDAQLQAEIDQLKAQNIPRDPGFVLPAMADNPDLMYSKEFVEASYNPVEVVGSENESLTSGDTGFGEPGTESIATSWDTVPDVAPPASAGKTGNSRSWLGSFLVIGLIGAVASLVYFIFIKEY